MAEFESRLFGAQSSNRLYVYAIVALIIIVAIMFMRTLSRRETRLVEWMRF